MSKNSKSLLLTKVALVVALVILSLAVINYGILLYLYQQLPELNDMGAAQQYVVDSVVLLILGALSLAALLRSARVARMFTRIFGGLQSLNDVIEHSEFSQDTGIAYLDANGRVISATKFLIRVSREENLEAMLDSRFDRVYSDNLSRLLSELLEKAQSTRQGLVIDIQDWSQYCKTPMGPASLYVAPSFIGEKYLGAIIVLRSTEDIRAVEDSSIYYQMHYQILFDNLPIGAVVCRPAVAADGGIDAYIVTANPALKKGLDGIPLPFNEPCSIVWPSFLQQNGLRDALSQSIATGTIVRCAFFAPALGKNLEVFLTSLPGGRILGMVLDQTEQRMNEQKVLALNDQLKRTLAGQSEYLSRVLDDIQHFNQATADLVETHLERIRATIPKVPEHEAAELTAASSGLYQALNQMLRYHNVANLPFKDTALVHPAEVVTRLLEPLGNRYPNVAFNIRALPGVVANREILTNILEQLMVSLAQLPVVDEPGRIEVGSQQGFTATIITVSGWGFDTSPIFIEIPAENQPLDWTLTSELDLASVRRMVNKHGGQLYIAPTPDGAGVELSFSIGAPSL